MLKNIYLLIQLGCLVEASLLHACNINLPSIAPLSVEQEQLLYKQIIQAQAMRIYKRLENLPTCDDTVPLYQIAQTLAENQLNQPQNLATVVKSVEQCTPHYLFWKKNVETKYLFLARGKILAALLPEEKARELLKEKFPFYCSEEEAKKAAYALDVQRNNINKNLEENVSKPTESPQTLLTKFPILTSPKRYALWVG